MNSFYEDHSIHVVELFPLYIGTGFVKLKMPCSAVSKSTNIMIYHSSEHYYTDWFKRAICEIFDDLALLTLVQQFH